jgi:hypothetical protein
MADRVEFELPVPICEQSDDIRGRKAELLSPPDRVGVLRAAEQGTPSQTEM